MYSIIVKNRKCNNVFILGIILCVYTTMVFRALK